MKPWAERSIEEANLLNPAFCCGVVAASAAGYLAACDEGLPFPLAFMVLPVVLYKPARQALPRSDKSMAAWLVENENVRIGLSKRIISFKPHTREAILFGIRHGWLSMGNEGRIESAKMPSQIEYLATKLTGEPRECFRKALMLGKWIAKSGTAVTVMNIWGIRP